MQKDVHFYLTYALAKKAGGSDNIAEKIAWADQYTDDLNEPDEHGIQTQTKIDPDANWNDRQIQLTVIIPFHFIPGNDSTHPWKTMPNSANSRKLVRKALKTGDPFRLGIALHAFQDTFSHQGFSGWREGLNSCFPWYYMMSALPNVGHAEMRVIPDIVNQVWTDPRSNKKIDNKTRVLSAAKHTYTFLTRFFNTNGNSNRFEDLESTLKTIFKETIYDTRKEQLLILSGNRGIKYETVRKKLEPKYKADFVKAARRHLSETMDLLKTYPY